MKHVILILCAVILLIPTSGSDQPKPDPKPPQTGDKFDRFADQYRLLLADAWMEMAETEFDSDQEQLEWINTRNQAARQAAWEPIHEMAADAVSQGPEFTARFATDLKERTLGIDDDS